MWWLFSFGIITAAVGAAMVWWNSRVVRFRNTAKVGDSCSFYWMSDRYHGTIIARDKKNVAIQNAFGMFHRTIEEIYP